MKVSIVVPVYNSEKTLVKCLDSILNQTYKNIEVLCINDGSIDSSLKILNEYQKKDKRIIILNQKQNRGVSYTKNHGIKKASGDYICFVDSDDYIDNKMIEKMYLFSIENKLDIVKCNYTNYIDDKKYNVSLSYKNKTILSDNKSKNEFIDKLISGEIPGYLPLIMIRSNIIKNNNIYINKNLNFLEDLLFYMELIRDSNRIGILNESLYNYINNKNGLTFSLNTKKIESRISGIICCNNEIKKMNILNKNQEKILDTRSVYMLIHSFMELYIIKDKNIKNYINENIKIFENANEHELDKFSRLSLKFIKKEKYRTLFILFFITKIYLKLKG